MVMVVLLLVVVLPLPLRPLLPAPAERRLLPPVLLRRVRPFVRPSRPGDTPRARPTMQRRRAVRVGKGVTPHTSTAAATPTPMAAHGRGRRRSRRGERGPAAAAPRRRRVRLAVVGRVVVGRRRALAWVPGQSPSTAAPRRRCGLRRGPPALHRQRHGRLLLVGRRCLWRQHHPPAAGRAGGQGAGRWRAWRGGWWVGGQLGGAFRVVGEELLEDEVLWCS